MRTGVCQAPALSGCRIFPSGPGPGAREQQKGSRRRPKHSQASQLTLDLPVRHHLPQKIEKASEWISLLPDLHRGQGFLKAPIGPHQILPTPQTRGRLSITLKIKYKRLSMALCGLPSCPRPGQPAHPTRCLCAAVPSSLDSQALFLVASQVNNTSGEASLNTPSEVGPPTPIFHHHFDKFFFKALITT